MNEKNILSIITLLVCILYFILRLFKPEIITGIFQDLIMIIMAVLVILNYINDKRQ
jgi:hypothetical protein